MDIISEIMRSMHLEANIYLHSQFCSPWTLDSDNPGLGSFHVIAYGSCTIELGSGEQLILNAGDLIFFPTNIQHQIQNDSGQEISTTLICGSFDFGANENPLLEYLPPYIHVQASEIAKLPWFESLFKQIVNEAESGSEGRSLILDKLAEILFVYILRYYVQTSKSEQGILAGLTDPHLSKALLAFHKDISISWTVEKLANHALMSRSAFSDQFSKLVKITPIQYVTFWRMQNALQMLKTTNSTLLEIALNHGYQSEAAFSKVFKKQFGISPGKARKQ